MHILSAVRRLEEEYADVLVAIGVHSGKFIAERVTENIRTATRRLHIHHPVVNDRHFRTWRAYNVSAWPTVVLLSPDGKIIGQHAGEFSFEDFDKVIYALEQVYDQAGMLDRRPLDFPLDPEPPSDSPLRFPGKVLADPAGGRLFIADTGNNRVLVAQVTGESKARVVQTIGSGEAGMRDGAFAEATLHAPEGMALHGDTLYIADTENHSIRAAHLDSGTLETVAGTGEQAYTRAGGVGTSAALSSPWDLLVRDNRLYIAMAGTHQLWRMDLQSGEVRPFVGSGRENIDDGPHSRATLAQPSGLTTDGERLYFADSESSAVRVSDFDPNGYTQTLLGEGLFEFGDKDGKGLTVRLQHNLGVSYHNGKIYIADTYNNKVKTYDLATKECHTSLGSGNKAELYEPGGLSVWAGDGGARLYVADTNNHRVLVSVIGAADTLAPPVPLDISFAPEAVSLPRDKDFAT
ncbi:MAG TPA: alkyl hydroperoxide reductase [Chloroflexia bacterium]